MVASFGAKLCRYLSCFPHVCGPRIEQKVVPGVDVEDHSDGLLSKAKQPNDTSRDKHDENSVAGRKPGARKQGTISFLKAKSKVRYWVKGLTNTVTTSKTVAASKVTKLRERNAHTNPNLSEAKTQKIPLAKQLSRATSFFRGWKQSSTAIISAHVKPTLKGPEKGELAEAIASHGTSTSPQPLPPSRGNRVRIGVAHRQVTTEQEAGFRHFVRMYSKAGVNLGAFRTAQLVERTRREAVVRRRLRERQLAVQREYALMRARLPGVIATALVAGAVQEVLARAAAKRVLKLADDRRASLVRQQARHRERLFQQGYARVGFAVEEVMRRVAGQVVARGAAALVLGRFWAAVGARRSVLLRVAAQQERRRRWARGRHVREWRRREGHALERLREERPGQELAARLQAVVAARENAAGRVPECALREEVLPYAGQVALTLPEREISHPGITVLPVTTKRARAVLDWVGVPVGAAEGRTVVQPVESRVLGLSFSKDRKEPREKINLLNGREEELLGGEPVGSTAAEGAVEKPSWYDQERETLWQHSAKTVF